MPSIPQLFIIILVTVFFIGTTVAATTTPRQFSFENWVERVKKQALSQGISPNTLDQAFADIKQIHGKEKTQSKSILTRFFPNKQQINSSKQLAAHYSNVLFEIKHLFGVDPEVIIAIWGVNNMLEKNTEMLPAIDVLTSLSYAQPSNTQFKTELFHALRMIEEGQVNRHQLTSDVDGHLGSTPFKPTTFRHYAIDYDGDGKFDVWRNHADIFASTANYLSSIGWKANKPWGIEVKLPKDFNPSLSGLNQQRKTTLWQKIGVRMPDGSDLPQTMPQMSSIISTTTPQSKTFLVFDNYFALLRWKRSQQFAFAVGMMTDKIRQADTPTTISPFAEASAD